MNPLDGGSAHKSAYIIAVTRWIFAEEWSNYWFLKFFQRDGLIPVRIGCRKKAARFAVADTAPHSRNCSKRINLFPYEVLECTAYNLTRTIRSLKYDAHTFGCLHTILIFSEADTADIKSSRELL